MQVTLSEGGTLNIPMGCDEVTFMQYIEFVHVEHKYMEASKGNDSEEAEKPRIKQDEVEEFLIDAVAKICTGDALGQMAFSLPDDNMKQLIDAGTVLGLGDDVSILRLYAHITTLFREFNDNLKRRHDAKKLKARKYKFEHEGQVYRLDTARAGRLFADQAFTTGEVLELKYFRRKFQQSIEQGEGQDGEFAFNLGLSEIAILCRKKGEQLPFDKRAREALITRRVQAFEHLPLSIVFTVRFFLMCTLQDCLKSEIITHISTAQAAPMDQ